MIKRQTKSTQRWDGERHGVANLPEHLQQGFVRESMYPENDDEYAWRKAPHRVSDNIYHDPSPEDQY